MVVVGDIKLIVPRQSLPWVGMTSKQTRDT